MTFPNKEQLDLFLDEYKWVLSPEGKLLFREYPAIRGAGMTVGEMQKSGRWSREEAVNYLDYTLIPRADRPGSGPMT